MFEIIFLAVLSIYFIQTVVFIIGAGKKFPKLSDKNLPSISVIVAARNEEDNITGCLQSLDASVYPEDKIEIIIVDDNSTDSTGKLIDEFISGKPKFKTVHSTYQIGDLKGKANAIANGIKMAKGEIVMTTDADCTVSPLWAKTLASYYQDDVAIVCGYTDQFDSTLFEAMQSLDFMYLLGVAGGAMNLGKPLSCIGNNMSYRRSVYELIGGYESIPFSVTEDFKLLMTIHQLKKYKVIYPLDENSRVTSKACPDFKSLYWQKKRWGVGGLDSDIVGYIALLGPFISSICILLAPFFYSANVLYLIVFKIFTDYFFMDFLYRRMKLKFKLMQFAAFEIYLIIYVLLLPTSLIFSRKVKWKGREYKRNLKGKFI